jgi:peptide-methionine (S)-S-oxide reductase
VLVGVEAEFRELGGVIDTNARFTDGSVSNPSYEKVCAGRTGHVEAVRVILNPARVSYEELLATFWEIHDPTQVGHQGFDIGEQYRSAVFAHGSRQMRRALASRGSEQRLWSRNDRHRSASRRPVLHGRALPPAALRTGG